MENATPSDAFLACVYGVHLLYMASIASIPDYDGSPVEHWVVCWSEANIQTPRVAEAGSKKRSDLKRDRGVAWERKDNRIATAGCEHFFDMWSRSE